MEALDYKIQDKKSSQKEQLVTGKKQVNSLRV